MILSSACLLFLAASPSTPPRCAPDDLACTAQASIREANAATDPRARAEALLTAARAYLLLYRREGEPSQLCLAQHTLRRLPRAQPPDLDKFLRDLRAEIATEQANLGVACKSAAPNPTHPKVTRKPSLSPRTPSSPSPSPIAEEGALAAESPPVADAGPLLEVEAKVPALRAAVPAFRDAAPTTGPAATPAPPALTVAPMLSDRPLAPRPGRGLLVGGGVVLTSASLFGALAVGAMVQRDDLVAKHDALASNANHNGYTAPDDDLARGQLAPEAMRWHRLMVGASISSGVLASVAVALISTGAAKWWRLSRRLAVRPAPGGVLLNARF
jgi:hypothetical protein